MEMSIGPPMTPQRAASYIDAHMIRAWQIEHMQALRRDFDRYMVHALKSIVRK